MSFALYTWILAVLVATVALLAELVLPRGLMTASQAARSRTAGAVLGLVCLGWSTHHILLMMEGGMSRYHHPAMVAMAALGVLCFFYLDYLATRALGGVLLLCINAALHQAFVVDLPARGLYATLCYALAIAAMIMIGLPWRFRQLLEGGTERAGWRHATGAVLGLVAAVLAGFSVLA